MSRAIITITTDDEEEGAGRGVMAVAVTFDPGVQKDEEHQPMSHIAAMVAVEAITEKCGDGTPPQVVSGRSTPWPAI